MDLDERASMRDVNDTLLSLGSDIFQLFTKIMNLSVSIYMRSDALWLRDIFAQENQRFELWATNLGLLVSGHGSLDYRVRESEHIQQALRYYLRDLKQSLSEALDILLSHVRLHNRRNGVGPHDYRPNQPTPTADVEMRDAESASNMVQSTNEHGSDDDDDYSDDESPFEAIGESLTDIVDRLFRLSTKIRNPSTRLGLSKAIKHTRYDEDSGVNMLESCKQFDYDYVESVFLQSRKTDMLRIKVPSSTEPISGTLNGEDPISLNDARTRTTTAVRGLIDRLAVANSKRRQQFSYWKTHAEKLKVHAERARPTVDLQHDTRRMAHESATNIGHPGHKLSPYDPNTNMVHAGAALSVTTATFLSPNLILPTDHRSVGTVSEYAPSTAQQENEVVSFPPPPKISQQDSHFLCPYCFTICESRSLSSKAWRAHLIHDLRPYICTFEDCNEGDQLYDNRAEWMLHEKIRHASHYICPQHSDMSFHHVDALMQHIKRVHGEPTHPQTLKACSVPLQEPRGPCPVCCQVFNTASDLQKHLAFHLERIALFSLPRSNDIGQEPADEEAASNVAEHDVVFSRSDDLSDIEGLSDLDVRSDGSHVADAIAFEDMIYYACPYAKYDPARYSTENVNEPLYSRCSMVRLPSISSVMVHLNRVHTQPPYHCHRCYESLDSPTSLQIHLDQNTCESRSYPFAGKMDSSTYKKLWYARKGTRNDRWYQIFTTLFPTAEQPKSPLNENLLEYPAGSLKFFACPYAKRLSIVLPMLRDDQIKLRGEAKNCSSIFLKDISRLKRHIKRKHCWPEIYCGTCYESFESRDDLHRHQAQRPYCEARVHSYKYKVTQISFYEIEEKIHGVTAEDDWYAIFNLIFPGCETPLSPYIDTLHGAHDLAVQKDRAENLATLATRSELPRIRPRSLPQISGWPSLEEEEAEEDMLGEDHEPSTLMSRMVSSSAIPSDWPSLEEEEVETELLEAEVGDEPFEEDYTPSMLASLSESPRTRSSPEIWPEEFETERLHEREVAGTPDRDILEAQMAAHHERYAEDSTIRARLESWDPHIFCTWTEDDTIPKSLVGRSCLERCYAERQSFPPDETVFAEGTKVALLISRRGHGSDLVINAVVGTICDRDIVLCSVDKRRLR